MRSLTISEIIGQLFNQVFNQKRLKVDESWSFVQAKKYPRWLWWVEEAKSGDVVAFVFGRRTTQATFRRLLSLLASAQITVSKWITDA